MPALRTLRDAGLKTAVLTNASLKQARDALAFAKLSHLFDAVLSSDDIGTFKPDPAAFRVASRHFSCSPERLVLVTAAGGSNRLAQQPERCLVPPCRLPARTLGSHRSATITTLADLAAAIDGISVADRDRFGGANFVAVYRQLFGCVLTNHQSDCEPGVRESQSPPSTSGTKCGLCAGACSSASWRGAERASTPQARRCVRRSVHDSGVGGGVGDRCWSPRGPTGHEHGLQETGSRRRRSGCERCRDVPHATPLVGLQRDRTGSRRAPKDAPMVEPTRRWRNRRR